MRQIYLLLFGVIGLTCCDSDLVKFTYYDTGQIKEKIYFPDKSIKDKFEATLFDTSGIIIALANYTNYKKNGIAKEYFNSGRLKIIRHFRDNQMHGIYKEYTTTGELKKEILYLDNKKIAYRDYFTSNDSIYSKFVSFSILNDSIYVEEGQLVYNSNLNTYEENMSFYYKISENKNSNQERVKRIEIRLINKYSWSILFHKINNLKELDSLRNIQSEGSLVIPKNNNQISIDIESESKQIIGLLQIQNNTRYDSTIFKSFVVYEMLE